jgi:histidinol-phosphatase (PHP family)
MFIIVIKNVLEVAMFDSHIHANFSTDSNIVIEDAIRRGKELGIGLAITEHMDINYPKKGQLVFNPDEYFESYPKYKNNNLMLGIELGMLPLRVGENRKIVEKYPFDFVLGSAHFVDDLDIYEDELYLGKNKKEVYIRYFEYIVECINSHDFIDSLAHIDYISRYARFKDKEIHYLEYADLIDDVLVALIQNGKALELNTRRFNSKKAVFNMAQIFKRYGELGGSMVTLGSDSHDIEDVAMNFDIAKDIIDIYHLREVYFKNRKPEYV